MNTDPSKQHRLALFFLSRLTPEHNRDAVAGDLLEQLAQGRSDGWLCHQVLNAIAVAARRRSHWSQVCFAFAGSSAVWLEAKMVRTPFVEHAFSLAANMHWPFSIIWILCFQSGFATITLLPVLAILLAINRTLHGYGLLRSVLLSFVLLTAVQLILALTPPLPMPPFSRINWYYFAEIFFALTFLAWAVSPIGIRPEAAPSPRPR